VDGTAIDWLTGRLLRALAGEEAVTPAAATLLLRRYVTTGRDDLRDALGPALAGALEASSVERDSSRRSEWLALFVEASAISDDDRLRHAAGALVGALRALWPSRGDIAPVMQSVGACLSAASDDNASALVPAAIDELERVVGLAYAPGEGLTMAERASMRRARSRPYCFETIDAMGISLPRGSPTWQSRSAYASFFASISTCRASAELWPYSPIGKHSRMFSMSRAATPWLFGGSSCTCQSR